MYLNPAPVANPDILIPPKLWERAKHTETVAMGLALSLVRWKGCLGHDAFTVICNISPGAICQKLSITCGLAWHAQQSSTAHRGFANLPWTHSGFAVNLLRPTLGLRLTGLLVSCSRAPAHKQKPFSRHLPTRLQLGGSAFTEQAGCRFQRMNNYLYFWGSLL